MPSCRKCKDEMSEHQFYELAGICPTCIRMDAMWLKNQKKHLLTSFLIIVISFFAFVFITFLYSLFL